MKDDRGNKTWSLEVFKSSGAYNCSEYNPNPSQVNIKLYSKSMFTSVSVTWYILSGNLQQKKFTRHAVKTRKHMIQREREQSSESDSDMTHMLQFLTEILTMTNT